MAEDDHTINFWPAFADFMLALVLIFLVAFGVSELGGVDSTNAKTCQELLEKAFRAGAQPSGNKVEFERDRGDPFLLRIRLPEDLLFVSDYATLTPRATTVLFQLVAPLSKQLPSIKEIEIDGHADQHETVKFKSNVHLAAERAVSVYSFLKEQGIDPSSNSLSAVSYGDSFPVGRLPGDSGWTKERIDAANVKDDDRKNNRRVEILIRYGTDIPPCRE